MMNFRARLLCLLLWMLLLGITAALLFATLRLPPPLSIDLGAAGDTPYIANFFPRERNDQTTFRWSTSGSRLLLYGSYARPLALEARLHGDERALTGDWRMQIEQDRRALARFPVQPGWRVYRVVLPAPGGLMTPLDLVLSAYRAEPGDRDLLGVPVDWMRITPLAGAATPSAGPLGWVLRLTWGLALLVATLWLLDRRVFPRGATRAAHLRVAGVAGGLAAGLILWAQRDPYALARMLPLPVWALATATLLSGGLWLAIERRSTTRSDRQSAVVSLQPDHLVTPSPHHPVTRSSRHLVTLAALAAHGLLLLPLPVPVRGTAAVLLLILPGALLAWLLFGHERNRLTLAFLGICGGVALSPLLLLALHVLPGPLPWWVLLLAVDTLSLWLGWQLWGDGAGSRGTDHGRWTTDDGPRTTTPSPISNLQSPIPILLILLLAAVFRLTFLGSAEFQGDEGRALLMASGVRHGHDGILLLHKKGPVEVLLPAGPLVLTGQINEWVARLPFALAGIGILLGSYVLARHLFDSGEGTQVGLLAAVILALDGFLIAFARIVQYQSVVVLMLLGALWCAWRFYAGAPHPQRYLVCAAALAAVGLLTHYDSLLALPALAWLVLAGGRRHGWRAAQWPGGLAAPVLVGAGLLASFYVPFALNERFARTLEYVRGRTGQDSAGIALFNNLIDYYHLATFYSTTFQIHALAAALLAGCVAWLVLHVRPRALGIALAALLLAGSVALVVRPALFEPAGGGNWAIVAFGLPLAGLALAPGTPAALRALVLWFGVAFVAEAFLIDNPKTHFYTMHTPAALLVALAVVRLAQWLRARRLRRARAALVAGGALLALLAIPYLYLVFLRQEPEYWTVFPEARPGIYRASYGDTLPDGGFFGFPRRAGWKVVGELYRQGALQGDYDSNEKEQITGWYTRGTLRCWYDADYYFAAWTEASSTIDVRVPPGYHLVGSVLVDNVKKLDIYSRQPVAHLPRIFTLDDYRATFDAQPVTHFPLQRSLIEVVPQYGLDVPWQRGVLLRGYDLDRQRLAPGQVATLVLYWREHATIEAGYEPVIHVLDSSGRRVGVAAPHCDVAPAEWNTQYLRGVAFTVTAGAGMPPGTYTLQVGLRHAQTGAWLPTAGGASALPFATLTVVVR